MGPRHHALDGVEITQRKGQFLGVVRPSEKHWEPLLRCTQNRLNRSAEPIEMPFGGLTHVGQRKHVLDGKTHLLTAPGPSRDCGPKKACIGWRSRSDEG